MGMPISIDRGHRTAGGAVRVTQHGDVNTAFFTAVDFVPASSPTDIIALLGTQHDALIRVRRVVIQATADSASSIDVLLQRATIDSTGTYTSTVGYPVDQRHENALIHGTVRTYSANRGASGNGIDSTRPVVVAQRIAVGTASAPASPATIDFDGAGYKGVLLRELSEILVVNLRGATMPTGLKLNISIVWTEERMPKFILAGSSSIDRVTQGLHMWAEVTSSELAQVYDFRNHGSNGSSTTDFINGVNGVKYSITTSIGYLPQRWQKGRRHKYLISYGANDVKDGLCDLSTLVSRLDTCITTLLAARPNIDIIMWGNQAFASDNYNNNNYVTLSGIFSGLTMAQASQYASEILYDAYEHFRADARVSKVIQKQDLLGRTSTTVAASNGIMSDQLHLAIRGQVLTAHDLLAKVA